MRVRLWLKLTRVSVATCQKERIVRRYLSLHWVLGAARENKRGIATTKHSASCNNTLRRFQRHGRLKVAPTKNHTSITTANTMATCNADLYIDSATARGMTNQTKPDKREFESALHPCVLKSTVHIHANKAKHDTVHYAYQIQLNTHQKVLQLVDIKPKN